MRVLETPRLLLSPAIEPLSLPALEQVHRLYVDELDGQGLTLEVLEQEIQFDVHLSQNDLGAHFGRPAVHLKQNRQRIGHCVFLPRLCTPAELSPVLPSAHLSPYSSTEIELGWAIATSYRNQGYATEVARALIHYGFTELGLARLIAFTEADNAASLKVMHHVGMKIGHHLDTNGVVGLIENTAR